MNLVELKNILKQINQPNEFTLQPLDLEHPLYWIFYIPNVREKSLSPKLKELRLPQNKVLFTNGKPKSDVLKSIGIKKHYDNKLDLYNDMLNKLEKDYCHNCKKNS